MEQKKTQIAESEASRQEVEKKLQERLDQVDALNSELKAILGNIKQGLIFIQSNGLVTLYNAAAEILLGISDKKVIGESIFRHFPDNFFGFSLKQALIEEKAPGSRIIPFQSLLSIDRVMEVETTYIPEPKKNKGLLILLRDITDVYILQKELDRAEKFKTLGEVSFRIVQAIRHPLNSIRGFATLLHNDVPHSKFVGHIIQGIDAVGSLLNDIHDFTKPVSAKKRQIDLVPILKEIEAKCANDQNIKIQFLNSTHESTVQADPNLIQRALWNLIRNSFESMPNGGSITLSLDDRNQTVIIGVADTGSGIPKSHLNRLFQPFFTTKPKRHGFGLTEVQRIMDAHQGKVELGSKENEGTFVSLTFYR